MSEDGVNIRVWVWVEDNEAAAKMAGGLISDALAPTIKNGGSVAVQFGAFSVAEEGDL